MVQEKMLLTPSMSLILNYEPEVIDMTVTDAPLTITTSISTDYGLLYAFP